MKKTIFLVCLLSGMTMATESTPPTFIKDGEVIDRANWDDLPKSENPDFSLVFDLTGFDNLYGINIASKFSVMRLDSEGERIHGYPGDTKYDFYSTLVYDADNNKWGTRYAYTIYDATTHDGSSISTDETMTIMTIVMHHKVLDDSNQAEITYSLLQEDETGKVDLTPLGSATGDYFGTALKDATAENTVWEISPPPTGTISNVRMWDSLVSAETIMSPSIPSDAVPEPTTATLSLLALAGLCARRRR